MANCNNLIFLGVFEIFMIPKLIIGYPNFNTGTSQALHWCVTDGQNE
jgi:hypothetical protein